MELAYRNAAVGPDISGMEIHQGLETGTLFAETMQRSRLFEYSTC
jgi:hypothetical protein